MTVQEFSQQYKAKNPQFSNMDDLSVAQMIVKAYPDWKNKIDFHGTSQQASPVIPSTPEVKKTNVLSDSLNNRANQLANTVGSDFNQAKSTYGLSLLKAPLNALGAVGGLVGDVVGAGINKVMPVVKKIASYSPPAELYNSLPQGAKDAISHQVKTATGEVLNFTSKAWNDFKTHNPEIAQSIEDSGNLANLAVGDAALSKGVQGAGKEAGVLGKSLIASGEDALKAEKQSFVRDLVSPVRTKAIKEAQVARTTETGSGILKKSIIAPTREELKAEEAVIKVPGVDSSKTYQQNFNIIQSHNTNLAKELETKVAQNEFLVSKKEVNAKLNEAITRLAESPTIVGDAQKTAEKLINGAMKIVNENKGNGSGILKARKDYDAWVLSQKPKAFDSATADAFNLANKEVRNTLNNILDSKIKDVPTKELRLQQSSLYSAMDNIKVKAAQEADTAFGRLLQRTGQLLGTKNKIVQGVAAAVGIGGLGAAATFAPAAAALGGSGLLIYKAGKLVTSPEAKIYLGKILLEVEKASKYAAPARQSEFQSLKTELKNAINSEDGFAKIPFTNPTMGKIDDLSSSIKQAKASGQSFDEWVKGQGETVYHGSPKASVIEKEGFSLKYLGKGSGYKGTYGAGATFTTDASRAKLYGDVVETKIPSNLKLFETNDPVSDLFANPKIRDVSPEGLSKILKEMGYDGVKVGDEIVVFDPSKIKTHSQLKAEWDKIGTPLKSIKK
jgi:hypothetical protein